ncbi:MAG: glycosyltransferase family 39 protein [Eubacteriales bacterium]|nr:glycosyltransferase family 39 protein [Eubacteriales bacterium]
MRRFQPRGKVLVALFFLALTAVGLATVADYGVSWDENGEIGILRMWLMEYHERLSWDTPFSDALEDMNIQPISQSDERDHGECLYYPLFFVACNTDIDANQLSAVWRGYTWLIFILGAFSLYKLGRRMGLNRPWACVGVLLLVLSPRIFAEAHYNNKDIALLSLTLLAMWQTVRLAEKPSLPRGLAFALITALCTGTRVIGAAVCALCGLFVLLRLALEKRLCPKVWLTVLATLSAAVLFYALLTPAMLPDPLGYVKYVIQNAIGFSRWHGTILYQGSLINAAFENLPFHYLPVMIALTTPVWALLLLLVGQRLAVRGAVRFRLAFFRRDDGFLVWLASLMWLVPLLACMVGHSLIYNGWRHFYFIYGPMVLLMVYALRQLTQGKRPALRRVGAAALAACLALDAVGLWLNHPYEYAYYNPFVSRAGLESRYEMDYWNVSCENALRQLLSQTDGQTLQIMPSDKSTRSGLRMAAGALGSDRIEVLEYASDSDAYILSNLTYAHINGFSPSETLKPVVALYSYGVPIMVIYQPVNAS